MEDEGHSDIDETLPDELFQTVGDALTTLVERRETIVGTLNQLRSRHLAGETIQPALNSELSSFHEGFPVLLHLLSEHGVESTVDGLVAKGVIDGDDSEAAIHACKQIEWVAPAGKVYLQNQRGVDYWTSTAEGLAGAAQDGTVLFGQRAMRGVDELWDVQAPLPEFAQLAYREVVQITRALDRMSPDTTFTESQIEQLDQVVDGLQEAQRELADQVDDVKRLHDTSGGDDYDDLLG